MDECCFSGEPDAWTKSSRLYVSWKCWSERAGEKIGTQKAFSQSLQDRGFVIAHRGVGNGFDRLRLIPEMIADER
jgi:phage/plasmid-associated DNA primase